MHPILAYRERSIPYFLGWLFLGALLAILATTSGVLHWREALLLILPMAVVYAFMCLAALYLCRAYPLQSTGSLKLVVVYTVASFLSSALWLMIIKGWAAVLSQVLPGIDSRLAGLGEVTFGVGVLLYLLAAVVHYLILAFESSRDVERRSFELQALAREAEVKALKAQIQPHFLFNSLNSISALTTINPGQARDMTLRLADFLRKTLKLSLTTMITLLDEVSLVEDYVAIEQGRFGSRLVFRKSIDAEANAAKMPPLLIQPLVENAIKHGIAHRVEGGIITLEAHCYGNRLLLAVSNPYDEGDRVDGPETGVGLANVSSRLHAAFGNEARIDTRRVNGLFRAEISLPLSL